MLYEESFPYYTYREGNENKSTRNEVSGDQAEILSS